MGGCNFRKILLSNVPKYHGGKLYVFWQETFKIVRILLSGTWSSPFHYGYCWSHEHSHSKKHNHSESCITVKVSRKNEKYEIYLANEGSGLTCFIRDRIHFLGTEFANEFGVMLRGRGLHKPEIAHDIVCIHSLMIYTDPIEYNIFGDTKAPLLRCFPYISKLKTGDILTTGQYKKYQTFSNLQHRPLPKNSFHSILIDLRDTSDGKNPLYMSESFFLFWCSQKPPTFVFNLKDVTRWLLQDK